MTGKAQFPDRGSRSKDGSPPSTDDGVIRLLSRADRHGGVAPIRIETHAALVFVGPRETLKIKRAVRYPYLDFSSLDKREQACRREFDLNRRTAPDLYLGVVAITRADDGTLAIDGPGEVVEWAVRMRSFAQADLLANRCATALLDAPLLKALVDRIHAAHADATVASPTDAAEDFAAVVAATCRGLAAESTVLNAEAVALFARRSALHAAALADLLRRRGATGHVRRCHGDLHLANIVMLDGVPVLFDALEFDERLATIDTLYDLAFLLMDLTHSGAGAAANLVLGRYLWRSGASSDLEALAALPLFLAERSAVRALVAAERAGRVADAVERDNVASQARSYLDRALDALAAQPPPTLLAIGGLSGTGKSTLAAALAPGLGRAPGAIHLRSDLERKALAGVAETKRLPAAAYRPETTATVYDRLTARARLILAAGHSVVLDAVCSTPEERAAIAAIASTTGARFHGLWLTADPAVLTARVGARRGDASDADAAVVTAQLARDVGPIDWTCVDAGSDAGATLARALTKLEATSSAV